MKKLSLVIAMILILAFAGSAFAAQVMTSVNGEVYYYNSTTPVLSGETLKTNNLVRGVQANQFDANGKTNYPYEIYLPNEINPQNYRIHSNYTKNTDACAACHATHTAVGNALLQWYTVYDTCMACHDGTVTTTYNVVKGEVGAQKTVAFGGMFGTGSEGSLSNHNVTGAMEIAAAPGGSVVDEGLTKLGGHGSEAVDRWNVEFGCESCHTPHGLGGNARILHPDPNGAASKIAFTNKWAPTGYVSNKSAVATGDAGIVANDAGIDTTTGKVYVAFKPVDDSAQAKYWGSATYKGNYTIINNREWPSIYQVNGVTTTSTGWKVDNTLGYTRLIQLTGSLTESNILSADIKVYGTPSIKVKMEIKNYLSQTAGTAEKVTHVAGTNGFCGACHTDYNTASAEVFDAEGAFEGSSEMESGAYSKAHRHQVGRTYSAKTGLDFDWINGSADATAPSSAGIQGTFTCLTCHVAHGTSEDYWQTTLIGAGGDSSPVVTGWKTAMITDGELAGSSVLKRMPNMGTCETCHAKGTGNEGYAANSMFETDYAGKTATSGVADITIVDNLWFIGEPIANAKANTWVGSAKCQPCHAEKVAGWKGNKHFTDARINRGSGCGSFNMNDDEMNCHMLGWIAMGKPAYGTSTFGFGGYDKKTLLTEASKLKGDDAAITCEACHGSAATHIQAPSAKNIYNPGAGIAGETAAQAFERENKSCGKCHNDREVVNASTTVEQINDGTIHDGPSAYAQSKHYTSGLVGCADCHDAHAEGALKLEYNQLCVTCHGTASIGAISNTMGDGSDHTFTFGLAGATALPSDAVATIKSPVIGGTTVTEVTYNQIETGYLASNRLSPSIEIKSADASQTYYSFTGGTWTLDTTATAVYGGANSEYTFDPANGRVTFVAGKMTSNVKGTYTFSYVNTLNPSIIAGPTLVMTVQP